MPQVRNKTSPLSVLGLMLLAVLLYSLIPLIVEWSGSWGSVAIITGVWMLCHGATQILVAVVIGIRHFNTQEIKPTSNGALTAPRQEVTWTSACLKALPRKALIFNFVASFQWLVFAWSARLIEVAVTTAVFEFWPVLFLIVRKGVLARLASRSDNYNTDQRPVSFADTVLVLVAGCGLTMAILSEGAAVDALGDDLKTSSTGILLAAIGMALVTLGSVTAVTVGESAQNSLDDSLRHPEIRSYPSNVLTKLSLSNVSFGIPRLVAGATVLAWGVGELLAGSPWPPLQAIGFGVALGLFHGVAGTTFFAANHVSRSDTINSLYYGVPVLALTWLWAFTEVNLSNAEMFLAGVIGVVAVNMVLHLDPEGTGRMQGHTEVQASGHGFKALVIALWASGSVVLLRDQWFSDATLSWSIPEYWAMLAICATVFVLILSFRQSRLTDRQREADRLTLAAHAEIEMCHESLLLKTEERDNMIKSLCDIDSKRQVIDIGNAYLEFRKDVLEAVPRSHNVEGRERLRGLLRDIEILANLRQQGRNVAEVAVMTLFAALTVFLALMGRPQAHSPPGSWAGFVSELVAMAFAAAISFLIFDLLDRGLERDSSLLRSVNRTARDNYGQPPGWYLNLYGYTDPTADRIVANVLGAVVLAAFAILLYDKWFW